MMNGDDRHLANSMRLPMFSLQGMFLMLIMREGMWSVTREAVSSDMSVGMDVLY